MRDKNEAKKAVVKMRQWLVHEMSLIEIDKALDPKSPYSKVYWLYQDVINFMDHYNQKCTESWLDSAHEIIEKADLDTGFDTVRVRVKLNMALISMGHGLNIDWQKYQIY